MNNFLPSEVMRRQKCDICGNYLSMGPVVIIASLEIVCGRCKELVNANVIDNIDNRPRYNNSLQVSSLYNILAEEYTFKCKNHYSGCKKLIKFNSTHEEQCGDMNFNCPLCTYRGNGCQLSFHFSIWHYEQYMDKPNFEVNFNFISELTEYMLFVDHLHYVVVIHILFDEYFLRFGVINLCHHPDLTKYSIQLFQYCNGMTYNIDNEHILIKYDIYEYFKIAVEEASLIFDWSESIHGRIQLNPFENTADKEFKFLHNQFQIKSMLNKLDEVENGLSRLIEDLNQKMSCYDQLKNTEWIRKIVTITAPTLLTCCQCHVSLIEDIYLCPKNHPVCRNCLNSKCNECQAVCQWSSANKILEDISITCEWTMCTEVCNFKTYLRHKQRCQYRRYKCPDPTCKFEGVKIDLIEHWHFPEPSLRTEEEPVFVLRDDYEFFWLMKSTGELVHVKMLMNDVPIGNERRNVCITVSENQAVYPNNYKIELRAKKRLYLPFSVLNQVGTTKTLTLQLPPNTYYKFTVIPQ